MLERELADFGARIGIPNLAWGEGDALTLTFDDLGSLTLACPKSEEDDFLLTFSPSRVPRGPTKPAAPFGRFFAPRTGPLVSPTPSRRGCIMTAGFLGSNFPSPA